MEELVKLYHGEIESMTLSESLELIYINKNESDIEDDIGFYTNHKINKNEIIYEVVQNKISDKEAFLLLSNKN